MTDYVISRSDGTTTATLHAGTATAFDDSGLTPVTTYTYTVAATDAATNASTASNSASVTTPVQFLFSDGFESGDLSQWSAPVGLSVQTGTVSTGTYAARATSVGTAAAWAYRQLATTQTNLGAVLSILGERESGTARLEDSVTVFRNALKERTRARANQRVNSIVRDFLASLHFTPGDLL